MIKIRFHLFYLLLCVCGFATANTQYLPVDLVKVEQVKEQLIKVDLVKVDKSARKMFLISGGKVIKQFHIALGDNPKGHKTQEGDNKTPEGAYFLDYKKEDSSYYRAFHINYPNESDIKTASQLGVEPGGQIMIHGQKNESRKNPRQVQRFNWTNGCIALTNSEMDEFMARVNPGTKIEISW